MARATNGLLPQSKGTIKNKSSDMSDVEQALAPFIGHRLTQKLHLGLSPVMTISICLVEPLPLPSKKKEVWK